jgi:hypothetical protein
MQKIKTISLALLLSIGICSTPALAMTTADEEIITKAVEATIRSVFQIMEDSRKDEVSRENLSDEDLLKYLNPEEKVTAQGLARIEKMIKDSKTKSEKAGNLQASILGIKENSLDSKTESSIEETIRSLEGKLQESKDGDKEEKIEITPISPLLLQGSTEPLMQFARGLTRQAISAEKVKDTLPVLAEALSADTKVETERVPAERYHRAAEKISAPVFSTQNLTILFITLTFLVIGAVLFFIRFERKLLVTDGKFKHLSSFHESKDKDLNNRNS